MLYIKSLLDGISSVVLGATLGPGVIFAALPVLVYQGSISLLAGALEPFLAGELLGQICGVGYCLVLCIGINFLGMTKIKTANMLPALLVPVLWSFLQPLVPRGGIKRGMFRPFCRCSTKQKHCFGRRFLLFSRI